MGHCRSSTIRHRCSQEITPERKTIRCDQDSTCTKAGSEAHRPRSPCLVLAIAGRALDERAQKTAEAIEGGKRVQRATLPLPASVFSGFAAATGVAPGLHLACPLRSSGGMSWVPVETQYPTTPKALPQFISLAPIFARYPLDFAQKHVGRRKGHWVRRR